MLVEASARNRMRQRQKMSNLDVPKQSEIDKIHNNSSSLPVALLAFSRLNALQREISF